MSEIAEHEMEREREREQFLIPIEYANYLSLCLWISFCLFAEKLVYKYE